MLKKVLENSASLLGYRFESKWSADRQLLYQKILERMVLESHNKLLEGEAVIIFSKDRAMQLEALLASYFFYVSNPRPVYVIYYASNAEYKKGYDVLRERQAKHDLSFIEETNFQQDLTNLITKLSLSKLFFLVDDLCFKAELDLDEFFSIDPKRNVASLRMGQHLNYSYTLQKEQQLPQFTPYNGKEDLLSWNIQESELDWNYPLSVDGHLFDGREIKIIVEELAYSAPNSFEEALQVMNPLFKQRKGVCYELSKIVNNPCNKVQVENDNISGNITVEELNNRWLSGYRIDFQKYKGLRNKSAHQELPIEFLARE